MAFDDGSHWEKSLHERRLLFEQRPRLNAEWRYDVDPFNELQLESPVPKAKHVRINGMKINQSKAVFLMQDSPVRAVDCIYQTKEERGGKEPDRVSYKTLDPHLGVDDYVVVETKNPDHRHGMSVVKIVAVDTQDDLDFDDDEEMRWVVGKIERADHESIKAQETKALEVVKKAQKRSKIKELQAAMNLTDEDLKAMPRLEAPKAK